MTSPVNAPSVQQRVTSAIANASARTGVPFDYLMDQARIESGMRPDARASTSSATGLFQFTKQTWLGTVKRHGAAHGLDWASSAITRNSDGSYAVADADMRARILEMRTDPESASVMAAEFAADNGEYLQSRVGANPEPVDLYLAHFLGAEGAARFLDAHKDKPDQAAAPIFPAAAAANRSIFYRDDGSSRSLADIRRNFSAKLSNGTSRPPSTALSQQRSVRHSISQQPAMTLSSMEPMPKRLDLDFARNAYRRLSGLSA